MRWWSSLVLSGHARNIVYDRRVKVENGQFARVYKMDVREAIRSKSSSSILHRNYALRLTHAPTYYWTTNVNSVELNIYLDRQIRVLCLWPFTSLSYVNSDTCMPAHAHCNGRRKGRRENAGRTLKKHVGTTTKQGCRPPIVSFRSRFWPIIKTNSVLRRSRKCVHSRP